MVRAIRVRMGVVGVIAAITLACDGPSPSKAEADEGASGASVNAKSTELKRVLDRVMAPPEIRTEQGFTARVLIPPGEMYDPLFMRDHGNGVWVADDGGQEPEKGRQGRIMAIDRQGNVSVAVALGRLLGPALSFDFAPASFAPYQGQIFTVSQPEAGETGAVKGHIVERLDPTTQQEAERFCALPPAGTPTPGVGPLWGASAPDGKGLANGGMEGRFGPENSPFAGKFFAVTVGNATVYQVTPDGKCAPFVTFDREAWGYPVGLAFPPDSQHMLVSLGPGARREFKATIARVRPDGTVETEQLVRTSPNKYLLIWAMAYAPAGFGDYGGQLFVAANNEKYGSQAKYRTNSVPKAGEVYRLTRQGELKLVASGFGIAAGVHFVGNRLWVSDIGGDYSIYTYRELPDGFVAEITPTP